MGKRRRIPDVTVHDPNEAEPCAECRAELRLLQRAGELAPKGRVGLGSEVLESLRIEDDLERMHALPARRRAK